MSHSKAEVEDFKCRAYLELGPDDDSRPPTYGTTKQVERPADLEGELVVYKKPGEEARQAVFAAFATTQTEPSPR